MVEPGKLDILAIQDAFVPGFPDPGNEGLTLSKGQISSITLDNCSISVLLCILLISIMMVMVLTHSFNNHFFSLF